jgi:hypothetical protein
MRRLFATLPIFGAAFLSGAAFAATAKPTVEAVDPSASIENVLAGDSQCVILKVGGKTYKQCPYIVSPEVMAIIQKQKK